MIQKAGFLNINSGAWSLIIANMITIIFAVTQNWNFGVIIWIYWSQSVTIGIFNVIRILSLKKFSTKNYKVNNHSVEPTETTKVTSALFFLFHYGFFHLGYAMFLFALFFQVLPFWKEIIIASFLFFISSLMDFIKEMKLKKKEYNLGSLMFFPYARIVPMHLTIIFGWILGSSGAIVFFMLLKTFADLIMHKYETYLGLH